MRESDPWSCDSYVRSRATTARLRPFYGHVLGFKGLERPAVVLAINGFRDEARAREMLYVGLSRARDLLVVCGDIDMIRRIAGDAVVIRLTQT